MSVPRDGASAAIPDAHAEIAARERQRQLTKPPGSLGRLEDLACWFAARLRDPIPGIPAAEVFVFAADHGVAARSVSAFPQAVTAQMVENFARGGAAINVLTSFADCRLEVVDVGTVRNDALPRGVRDERIRAGTADLSVMAAMTVDEARAALAVGERCACEAIGRGARLLIAGEMGIANTTAAACLICALTDAPAESVVGRGTGIDDDALARKRDIVRRALARVRRQPPPSALELLAELGGLEIAAMCGFYLEAARRGVPVLLDGYVSAAAALVAVAIDAGVREWMLAAHRSAEPGHVVALEALGLRALLDLGMRLGEGSGAVLALPIVYAALALHREMATFDEAGVADATSAQTRAP